MGLRRFFTKDPAEKAKKTIFPFVLLILVGFLFIWYPANWRFSEFIHPLGDAVMIAGLIGSVIELWSASVLVDHATEELSERLVGYGLPKAAQELIHNLVHKTKRVYREHRTVFRVESHPTNTDQVRVTTTLSYKVVNNGVGSESYSPMLAEEGMYNPTLLSLEYADELFTQHDLKPKVSETGVVTFAPDKQASIAPSNATAPTETLDKDHCCFVKWEFTTDMPKTYSTGIVFAGVTVNPVIEVQGSEKFEFDAETRKDCSHVPGGRTWTYNRAFIGEQHVRVWWKPRV